MSLSIADFWKLVARSELLSQAECQRLDAAFSDSAAAAGEADARSLAQWLVSAEKLTRYQAAVLLSGRPGPFVFGPLVITDRIDQGRLARLFRASYNGKSVLLVPVAQVAGKPDAAQLAEWSKAAAAVRSPHVSRTHGAVRQRSQTFVVVESLEGHSLAELLPQRSYTPQAASQIGYHVALALVALHHAGLVHGGVSPHNVWVGTDGAARLLQFPLVAPAARQERQSELLVDYLAPELADEQQPATPAGDIYGLGCTLYELVAGRPPFAGGRPQEKIARHRGEDAPPLDQVRPEVAGPLADLVSEMLAKDPSLRVPTAQHVAQRLKTFAADPTAAQRPLGAPALKTAIVVATPDEPAGPSIVVDGDAPDAAVPLVVTDQPSVATIVPRRKQRKSTLVAVGAAVCLVLALAVAVLVTSRDETTVSTATTPDAVSTTAASVPADDADLEVSEASLPAGPVPETAGGPNVQLVEDDGQTLWASPTAGEPIDLAYLPGGGQVFLILRPQDLWSSTEGNRLVDALGPGGRWAQQQLESTLGVKPTDVEQLAIAFVPDESLAPRAAYVMRLASPIAEQLLLAEWGRPSAARHADETYYEKGGLGYYLPKAGEGRIVAIAPVEMLKQVIDLRGSPLLRGSIESLLRQSDNQRQFTLVFTPSYLFTDGRELFAGSLARLQAPLKEFLDERSEAVMFSAHVGEELFVELRMAPPAGRKALEQMELVSERWNRVPERVESYVAGLDPAPHGALVVHRFPRMLQLARDFTRSGIDHGQVVMRAYLPASAAHNLVLGAELTLLESPGAVRVAAEATGGQPAPPRPLAERLADKLTLSFAREPLDRAVELLSGELGVPIVIEGSDLQLEGITKNQSLNNFDERDQPADEILRKVLKLANPDGKLVYVIKPADDGGEAIHITTRAAAQKRGEQLPPGF